MGFKRIVILGYNVKSDSWVLVSLITNQLIPRFGKAPPDPTVSSHWVPTSRINNSYEIFG